MSGEIKINRIPKEEIDKVKSTIEALEKSIAKEIEGSNNLEIVDMFNEIKTEYDDLLSLYESVVLNNVEATRDSINQYLEADSRIGQEIKSQMA